MHALVIAAIFVPYMGLMGGLFAYIWHTGQPCGRDDSSDGGEGELVAVAA